MTKKSKSIDAYKHDDLELVRQICLDILNNEEMGKSATGAKAQVEAGKLLGRLHKALQVDKQVIKGEEHIEKPKLKPETYERLKKIAGG